MIDIENDVFNYVANALYAAYNPISIYGEPVEVPESFPSVSIVEDDNSELESNVTLTREAESACQLMYTVNTYSNKAKGKKTQAKEIMNLIDARMHDLGFVRTMRGQLPNVDRTVYRVTARYTKIFQILEQED